VERFVLREFATADAAALTAMLHRSFAELGRSGLNFTAVDQDVDDTLRHAEGATTWLVLDGDTIAATATMRTPPEQELLELSRASALPNRAWLNRLAVDPDYRGLGLASRLWELCRDWARAAGATHVGLDTAAPATHLVELYSHWGFRHEEYIHWPGKTYDSTIMIVELDA
jgi:GNAT superfamily N-acetyltransferase